MNRSAKGSVIGILLLSLLQFTRAQFCEIIYDCDCSEVESQWAIDCQSRGLGTRIPAFNRKSAIITTLNLTGNGIVQVQGHAFDMVSNVQELILRRNLITTLHPYSFVGLNQLTFLDLAYNNLTTISAMAFADTTSQQWSLDLSYNSISELSYGAFSSANQLRNLSLAGNQLEYIHHRAFDGLEFYLEYLDLTGNKLRSIPSLALMNLFKLGTLKLADNNIKTIDLKVFPTALLQYLDLSGNEVRTIQSGVFANCSHLRRLDLTSNIITDVYTDSFRGLKSLEFLFLSNNKLRMLQQTILKPLGNLKYMSLLGNPISCACNTSWMQTTNFEMAADCATDINHHTACDTKIQKTIGMEFATSTRKTPSPTSSLVETKPDASLQYNILTSSIQTTAKVKIDLVTITSHSDKPVEGNKNEENRDSETVNTQDASSSKQNSLVTVVVPVILVIVLVVSATVVLILYCHKRGKKSVDDTVVYIHQNGMGRVTYQPLQNGRQGHTENGHVENGHIPEMQSLT